MADMMRVKDAAKLWGITVNRHKGTKKSKIIEKYFGDMKKVRTFAVPNVKNNALRNKYSRIAQLVRASDC